MGFWQESSISVARTSAKRGGLARMRGFLYLLRAFDATAIPYSCHRPNPEAIELQKSSILATACPVALAAAEFARSHPCCCPSSPRKARTRRYHDSCPPPFSARAAAAGESRPFPCAWACQRGVLGSNGYTKVLNLTRAFAGRSRTAAPATQNSTAPVGGALRNCPGLPGAARYARSTTAWPSIPPPARKRRPRSRPNA